MYPKELSVKVFRGSSMVYLTEALVQSYISDLQHCFTSSEGKAESYNENFINSDQVRYFETFLLFNIEVGGHFTSRNDHDGASDETESSEISLMHELSRKALSAGYYNHQVYHEMVDRDIVGEEIFGPKIDPSDPRRKLSYKDTLEAFMKRTDEKRRNELYEHTPTDCSIACRKRGCGQVATCDGLWKITYKICMWEPKNPYPDRNILEYLPNVCPEQPASGSAFCELHAKMVEKQGYPSQLRPFLEKCGANTNSYSAAGRDKVKTVLEKISKENTDPSVVETAVEAQGVSYLLRNHDIANAENLQLKSKDAGDCRKDIGEAPRLHRRCASIVLV